MKQFIFYTAIFLFGSANNALAVEDFLGFQEEDDFAIADNSETTKPVEDKVLSNFLSNRISATAAINIEKAEKVFCYTVDYADPQEQTYTLNGMAIKGSCGELSANGKKLFNDVLWHNAGIFSGTMDNCSIKPKIMLRYIYGPDSTDVLLSYPCPAVTFFNGRDVVTVNAAPGEKLIEQITKTYSSLSESYVSPALLGQMVPNGQILNQAQKEKVRRFGNSENSRKKWEVENKTSDETSTKSPVKSGWNKLK